MTGSAFGQKRKIVRRSEPHRRWVRMRISAVPSDTVRIGRNGVWDTRFDDLAVCARDAKTYGGLSESCTQKDGGIWAAACFSGGYFHIACVFILMISISIATLRSE